MMDLMSTSTKTSNKIIKEMKMKILITALFIQTITLTQAFTKTTTTTITTKNHKYETLKFATSLNLNTGEANDNDVNHDSSSSKRKTEPPAYGEKSRQYRRDVFGYEDWLQHRRNDRFLYNLRTMPSSGIWRQLLKEMSTVSAVALCVIIWNEGFGGSTQGGYIDFDGVKHAALANLPQLKLPALPFTLASPSLSLLLIFRTNVSYARWAEARQQWGVMGTENRNIMRMAAAWSSPLREPNKEKRVAAVQETGTACYVFFRSMLRHVSGPPDEESFCIDLREALPEKEAEAIIEADHRPFRALFNLSRKVEALPMSERQRIEVDKACVIIGDTCGGTERIYGTPVPLSYTRHTSRYLSLWLFLLPLALYEPFGFSWNHIGMIPAEAAIAGFLYGIEELSIQLEEPFSILALPGMVSAMKGFSQQLPQWHAMYTDEEYTPDVYGGEEFTIPNGATKITNIRDFPSDITDLNGAPIPDFEKAGWWVFE